MFSDALVYLGQNGALRMRAKLEDASIPNNVVAEPSLLVNCLQLADYVGMNDDGIKHSIGILRNATHASDIIEIHDAVMQ